MTGFLKSTAKNYLPTLYDALRAAKKRIEFRQLVRRMRPIDAAVIGALGTTVSSGPFKGMRYAGPALWSSFLPKLLGCYEAELHPAFDLLLGKTFSRVINIGCAEGYYAAGLALRFPAAEVWAFDCDPRAQAACRELARWNGVEERMHIAGACTTDELRRLTAGPTLVVCDCEGYEFELLDPRHLSDAAQCYIVVELHDPINPQITPAIRSRFAATHRVNLIEQSGRDPEEFPALAGLSPEQQRLALEEFRPAGVRWAYLEPKDSARTA